MGRSPSPGFKATATRKPRRSRPKRQSGVVVFSPQAALPCADTVTNPGGQVTGPRDGMQPRGTARNRSPLLPLPESSATCRASSPSMGCSRQSAQMPRRRSQTNRAPYHVGHASLLQASIRMRRRRCPSNCSALSNPRSPTAPSAGHQSPTRHRPTDCCASNEGPSVSRGGLTLIRHGGYGARRRVSGSRLGPRARHTRSCRESDVAIRPMRAKTQPRRSKCLLAQVLTRKRVIPPRLTRSFARGLPESRSTARRVDRPRSPRMVDSAGKRGIVSDLDETVKRVRKASS